jgi:hypothetical protein
MTPYRKHASENRLFANLSESAPRYQQSAARRNTRSFVIVGRRICIARLGCSSTRDYPFDRHIFHDPVVTGGMPVVRPENQVAVESGSTGHSWGDLRVSRDGLN